MWYVDEMSGVQWGALGDIPIPADCNRDGQAGIALYRPAATGSGWFVKDVGSWTFGRAGDIPLPQDMNGDGVTDLVLYRPSTATWYIYSTGTGATQTIPFGALGEVPSGPVRTW